MVELRISSYAYDISTVAFSGYAGASFTPPQKNDHNNFVSRHKHIPVDPGTLHALQHGTPQQRLDAMANLLSKGVPPCELKSWLKAHNCDNKLTEKLLHSVDALKTLTNPHASLQDKIAAALSLASEWGGDSKNKIGDFLKKHLPEGDASNAFCNALQKMLDPHTSFAQRIKDGMDAANALSGMGLNPSCLKKALAKHNFIHGGGASLLNQFGDMARLAHDVKVLQSKCSSPAQKRDAANDAADAFLDLAKSAPGLKANMNDLKKFMSDIGLPQGAINDIAKAVGQKLAHYLPPEIQSKLSPDVASQLTMGELSQLQKLCKNPGMRHALADALAGMHNPDAVKALLSALQNQPSGSGKKSLLHAVASMGKGIADKLLSSTIGSKSGANILGDVLSKLNPLAQNALGTILGALSEGGAKAFLGLMDKVANNSQSGSSFLNNLLPFMQHTDKGKLGSAFDILGKCMDAFGSGFGAKFAADMLKSIFKMVPGMNSMHHGSGAHGRGGGTSHPHLPGALGFLAHEGHKLTGHNLFNTVKSILGEAGAHFVSQLGMGAASAVLDLAITNQIDKFKADPQHYSPPNWVNDADTAIRLQASLVYC